MHGPAVLAPWCSAAMPVALHANPALRFRQLAPKPNLHHENQLGVMTIAEEVRIPKHSLGIRKLQKLRSRLQTCQLRPQGSALALQSCILRFQSVFSRFKTALSVYDVQSCFTNLRVSACLRTLAAFSSSTLVSAHFFSGSESGHGLQYSS